MARTHQTLVSLFNDIATSIQSKKGTSQTIIADNFPSEIDGLNGKGLMLQEENQSITTNKKSFVNTIVDTRPYFALQWRLQSSPYTNVINEHIEYGFVGKFSIIATPSFSGQTEFVHNGLQRNIPIYFSVCNVIQNHKYFLSIDVLGANVQVVGGLSLDNMMIIDLTQRFGEGNEPNLETCKKLFSDYSDYDSGTLVNKNIQQITQDLIKLPSDIGVLDMGTLAWYYSSSNGFFYSEVIDIFIITTTAKAPNLLCPKYLNALTKYSSSWASEEDKRITQSVNLGQVCIKDTGYNNATDLKNSLNGVPLFYKKA